jgi:transcriptional regulator with XRE-family HTH domain
MSRVTTSRATRLATSIVYDSGADSSSLPLTKYWTSVGRPESVAKLLQVTPQTISNWLYRRKRPSLDKYLAVTEFSTQNAVMEMPPRVRKMLNELEAYAKRNRVKQKDLAKDLGVEPQRLSDWLRGHRTPNAERILKIQEFLRTKES